MFGVTWYRAMRALHVSTALSKPKLRIRGMRKVSRARRQAEEEARQGDAVSRCGPLGHIHSGVRQPSYWSGSISSVTPSGHAQRATLAAIAFVGSLSDLERLAAPGSS